MSLPLLAIVGRPNVGKSTLFNRLVGERLAIVEDSPGVTRDRLYSDATWFGRRFTVVDTGGYEPISGDPIMAGVRDQARIAMDEADVICLVVDGRDGLSPADQEIAAMIRRAGQHLVVAVNKIDGQSQEPNAAEFAVLGIEDILPVSAAHNRGVTDLVDRLLELLPVVLEDEEEAEAEDELRVAFIGRPNVGKSTLINRLLGEERCLVSNEPGTTRDVVDTRFVFKGQTFRLIDTAGIRRKSKIHLDLERYTVVRSLRAIDRSHVVCFLLDAQSGMADQDARIATYAKRKGRAAIILLNKWDLLTDLEPRTLVTMERQLHEQHMFLPYAPVLSISAATGHRVSKVLDTVLKVRKQQLLRVGTGPLNRVFQEATSAHYPPLYRGNHVKFYYITQVRTAPPTFVISCNHPEGVTDQYKRYIERKTREQFPFEGTPLVFEFRKRGETAPTDGDEPGAGGGPARSPRPPRRRFGGSPGARRKR